MKLRHLVFAALVAAALFAPAAASAKDQTQQFFEQMQRVADGLDPINVFRDEHQEPIEVPQEREKFGIGANYLADVLAATQARFSPRRDEIVRLFAEAAQQNALRP